MDTFDRMGPKTRAVIRDSPLDLRVGQMLAAMPATLYSDDPATFDENLATWIRSQIERKMFSATGSRAEATSYVLARRGRIEWRTR